MWVHRRARPGLIYPDVAGGVTTSSDDDHAPHGVRPRGRAVCSGLLEQYGARKQSRGPGGHQE